MPNSVALGQTVWSSAGVSKVWRTTGPRYDSKFGRSKSNCWRVTTEIIRKSLTPLRPAFQVTQGHWNRHGFIHLKQRNSLTVTLLEQHVYIVKVLFK